MNQVVVVSGGGTGIGHACRVVTQNDVPRL